MDCNETKSSTEKQGIRVYRFQNLICIEIPNDEGTALELDKQLSELYRETAGFNGYSFVGEFYRKLNEALHRKKPF